MKDNKEESKNVKEEKIIDKKYIKESILTEKNAPAYNKKPNTVINYMNNSKLVKNKKFTPRCSFRKDSNKSNIISTNKNEKISLNKTLDHNTNKNLMKKTNTTKNINELNKKRNSLCLNTKNDFGNNAPNNSKLRKSLVIMNNNQKKLTDKRTSLVLQKNKNNAEANKDGAKGVLDEIVEKNEDKKEIDYYGDELDYLDNLDKRFKGRAYSKKITERDRQKKLNKLNKDSFGAVAKYTKKTAQFVKRDKKEIIKNNVFKNLKVKNERILRTKTNSNIINNENIIKNNVNKNNNEEDWSNRNLAKTNKTNNNQKKLHKKMNTNLYDKYNNSRRESKIIQNTRNNRGENIRNNIFYKTLTNKNIINL